MSLRAHKPGKKHSTISVSCNLQLVKMNEFVYASTELFNNLTLACIPPKCTNNLRHRSISPCRNAFGHAVVIT